MLASCASCPAGASSVMPNGMPSAPHRGRQRQAAEVEQVDEIGVGAEPGVELDRIGQHLRGRIGGRRRRQHHRVEIGKGALGDAPQRLQAIERGKRVGRGQPRAGRGDLARHRMNRIRRGRQQIADHQIAFGDPRSLIEQPRGLIKRLEIEFDQRGAERGPALQRLAIGFLRGAVAEEDQLAVARHAEPELAGKRGHRAERPVARERIGAVGAGHRRQRRHGVVDGQREHRNAIQRPAGRHQPGVGDQPEARLQSDDVVEHRRHAAAAGGVGAERQRHQPGGNRDRRSRTRSARNEIGADRIDGNAIGRADADEAGRELIEIGLADDDGAGRAQFCDRRRILRRHVGEGRAGGGGRHAQRVDIVLHGDRHAEKRKLRGVFRRQALPLPPAHPSRRAG